MAVIVISLERGVGRVIPAFVSGELLKRLHPLHLWFLEYLLLFIIGGLFTYSSRWFPETFVKWIHSAYRWALQKPFAPVLVAIFSTPRSRRCAAV